MIRVKTMKMTSIVAPSALPTLPLKCIKSAGPKKEARGKGDR